MILAFPAAFALVQQCAPGIAPEAILSIVRVESRFDPLAINVNHVGRIHAATPTAATAIARRWIHAGYSVDVGLAQINSRNLGWTGLSVEAAFEPCANLAAAEKILSLSYARASREAHGLEAISRALSLYNSGSTTIGFHNNYVARVWQAAEEVVPQLGGALTGLPPTSFGQAASRDTASQPSTPAFVVAPGDSSVLIFK